MHKPRSFKKILVGMLVIGFLVGSWVLAKKPIFPEDEPPFEDMPSKGYEYNPPPVVDYWPFGGRADEVIGWNQYTIHCAPVYLYGGLQAPALFFKGDTSYLMFDSLYGYDRMMRVKIYGHTWQYEAWNPVDSAWTDTVAIIGAQGLIIDTVTGYVQGWTDSAKYAILAETALTSGGGGLWADADSYIYPNNYTQFAITDNGFLGIGTTGPNNKLHVKGSGSGYDTLVKIDNTGGRGAYLIVTGGTGKDMKFGTDDYVGPHVGAVGLAGFAFPNAGDILPWVAFKQYNWGRTGPGWRWGTFYLNNVQAEDEAKNNYFAGNVGIGITTPAEKLHIKGNLKFKAGVPIFPLGYPGTADTIIIDGVKIAAQIGMAYIDTTGGDTLKIFLNNTWEVK